MFSHELNAAAKRLLADQKARAERERQRLEKERILAERQKQREQQREEEARRKRLEQEEAEERAKEAVFEERERNRGVYLRVELQALPADEAAVQAKGVKRSKDKLILPPSVGASLMSQDASKNGAMLFEVALPTAAAPSQLAGGPSSASGPGPASTSEAPSSTSTSASTPSPTPSTSGRTHAGVLEFTAPEGTVLLPRKVVQSLYGSLDAQPYGNVVVSYRRLEKGSYVRLQPMCHGFHEALGEGLREELEGELRGHSTLTEGDWLTVSHGGREWPLRVQELRPCPAVSVLDVDLSADVVPSLEAEEYLRRWEQEQARQQQLAAERAEREAAEAAAQAARQATEAEAAAAAAAAREQMRERLAAALPSEPEPAAGRVVTCAFSLPDGTRITRRFAVECAAQVLFDFVDSRGAGGWERGSYQLVTRMPRRVIRPPAEGEAEEGRRTLEQAGLGGGAEALLLEALPPPAPTPSAAMEVDGSTQGMATA